MSFHSLSAHLIIVGKHYSNLRGVQCPVVTRIGSPTDLRRTWRCFSCCGHEKHEGHRPTVIHHAPNQCLDVFVFGFACLSVFLLIFAALPSSWGTEICGRNVYCNGDVQDPRDCYRKFTVTKHLKLFDY